MDQKLRRLQADQALRSETSGACLLLPPTMTRRGNQISGLGVVLLLLNNLSAYGKSTILSLLVFCITPFRFAIIQLKYLFKKMQIRTHMEDLRKHEHERIDNKNICSFDLLNARQRSRINIGRSISISRILIQVTQNLFGLGLGFVPIH